MADNVKIRQLTKMEELYQLQQVEKSVWQMSPIPVHQTYTALHNGGVILGAFDGTEMIGFLYSFAGFNGNQTYLCSHMLGIIPAYRKDGLGARLKQNQAKIARELGYSMITWTFDPLESLNAYLNLHKLGAVAAFYKENYYGSMNDSLNQGLPTDRFQIEWYINETKSNPDLMLDNNRILLDVDENGVPFTNLDAFNPNIRSWFVAIPWNFQLIKKENIHRAKEWRQKASEAFQVLFDEEYTARDLFNEHSKQISYYCFSK